MCGIAGLVDVQGPSPSEADLRRMLGRIAHRGPDDEGCAILGPAAIGMRRLSILDPTPRGHQPMRSADGRYTIVHNGEIYNFLELASDLEAGGHRFATATDTEVILAAYAQWGAECVTRLNGIWAFAIWDGHRRELFLSRDQFGVKPMFLARDGGRLAFASEIKALLALPSVSADPEPAAVADFLREGLVDHTDATFYRSIHRLPAAHSLLIDIDRREEELVRYWGPPPLADDATVGADPRDHERVEEIRSLLVDAVALQLRSDVPLGSCLSGGLDSSSIVGIAAGLRSGRLHARWTERRDRDANPQLAFFAEFREPGIDERAFVDAVVERTGVSLRTTTPTGDPLALFDAVLQAQDEPFGSTSVVAQYSVMSLARDHGVKVLLDGQGADELFAGYPPYRAMRWAGALRSGDPRSLRVGARQLAARRVPWLPALGHLVLHGAPVPRRLRRNRMAGSWLGDVARRARFDTQVAGIPPPGTPLARNLWREIEADNLPALLRYEDRNSMAFGIEARVPYLDHRLVEAALVLPDRLRISGDEQKVALRRAVRGLVPDAVLDRRDKIAFQAPQRRWLTAAAEDVMLWPTLRAEAEGFLRPGALAAALDRVRRGEPDAPLWRIVNLEQWLRLR